MSLQYEIQLMENNISDKSSAASQRQTVKFVRLQITLQSPEHSLAMCFLNM